jgi:porin
MAKKGVTLDLDLYWMPQAILSGGNDGAAIGTWGNAIAALKVDTGKAGLWPGGYFKVQTATSFGSNLISDVGTIVPANISWLVPSVEPDTGLQEFTYTQFLSPHFAFTVGKINSISPTGVLHGDYTADFQNTALIGPMTFALMPLSAYGAGVVILPSHNVHLAAIVLDPNGTIMNNDLGDAFDDGVTVLVNADLKIKPGGLNGHQNLTFSWSSKDRTSLVQDPGNVRRIFLESNFPLLGDPGPILSDIFDKLGVPPNADPLNTEDDTWTVVYSFEQFVWQPAGDPTRGLGIFFSAGLSDGNPNPVKSSVSLGLVGKGVVPNRPGDNFGIGWARTNYSEDFLRDLRDLPVNLGLDNEDVVELYYNAAVTPWLRVSPSLQIISPALNKTVDPVSQDFKNIDTTYIAGVRIGVRF